MFLDWKPRTNTTSRRRSSWHGSSMTRRSLMTVSSTSGSNPTWPHEPLCMTSSAAAAAWTRSRVAAPRCPSSSRGDLMVVANVGDSRVGLGIASNDGAITLQETDKCLWVKVRTWVPTFLLESSSWVMLRTWVPTFLS
jgi:hypothetical protein